MELDVVNYIKEAKSHGLNESEIKQNLLNVGWTADAIEESFSYVRADETRESPVVKPEIKHEPQPVLDSSIAVHPVVSSYNNSSYLPLSEQHFTDNTKKPGLKKPAAIFTVVILLLAAAGAGAYYTYYLKSTSRIKSKIAETVQPATYQSNFSFTYKDPGISNSPFSVGLTGETYQDNESGPVLSMNMEGSFSNSDIKVGKAFRLMFTGEDLYLNFGKIALLNEMFGTDPGLDWIKLNFAEMQKVLAAVGTSTETSAKSLDSMKSALTAGDNYSVLADEIITVEKILGEEQINGSEVYHLQHSVDKELLKIFLPTSVERVIQRLNERGQDVTEQDKVVLQQAFSSIIDKLEVKEFESWVGKNDFRVHKIRFISNAPKLSSMPVDLLEGIPGLQPPQAKARDQARLTYIKKLGLALNEYKNQFGGYPASLKGEPQGLVPTFIPALEKAPLPTDGNCTEYFNEYWYEPSGAPVTKDGRQNYPEFLLTYCIGSNIDGATAGIGKITEKGQEYNIACPTTPDKCIKQKDLPERSSTDLLSLISQLDFTGEVRYEITFTNFGLKKTVEPPKQYIDLFQEFMKLLQRS